MGTDPRDENAAAQDWRSTVDQPDEPDPLAAAKARAAEPGRGRDATSPAEIPARGWRDILLRVFWCIPEDRVLSTAGSVAFFALLAVFPGLATVVSLYGLFADAGRIGAHLALLEGILPDGVLDLVGATREHEGVRLGASPRASLQLLRAAKAVAAMAGREHVLPDDVRAMRYMVLRHRLILTFEAVATRVPVEEIIDGIFGAVPTP